MEAPAVVAERKLPWLVGGGEMAGVIAAIDWSDSPLGPIESWPQSLRTTVSLCLSSNFPINIIWGDGHNQIYNDGYRVVCGAVHPRAMGEDYRVTWASAWPAIGQPFERALGGETSYLENQRMFLERNGYPEETFFTFSLSPIRDETGKVAGLFHPVTETTATMLGERRTQLLRAVADKAGHATELARACDLLLDTLAEYVRDLPFVALYLTGEDGSSAHLWGVRHAEQGGPLAPVTIALRDDSDDDGGRSWPLAQAGATSGGRPYLVTDVRARLGDVAAGEYPEPLTSAFVVPIQLAGQHDALGFLVTGASTRLPLPPQEAFLEMLGAAATSALGNAHAYELERQRAEALAALDRAKTTFFSNVSHELRTPLTLILGPLEQLLAGREAPAAVRDELVVVHRNAARLLKLVNALLDFSRIEAGRHQARLEPTDLAALTREVASAFQSAVVHGGMKLVVDVPPLDTPVAVDRDMWEKIVLNLVSNAFKFTHRGQIVVSLRRVGGSAELTVADSGIGIDEAHVARVFERFHRVEGAGGRTHEGTGIGLALVKDLAELHGGTASVTSRVGVGSTFTVRVPVTANATAAAVAPTMAPSAVRDAFVTEAERLVVSEASAPLDASSADLTDAPTVLLADDNADMRDYVARLLRGHYRVTTVSNGAEALRAAAESRPQLILSDVMMPVMTGAELVRELRAHPRLRTIPVILLSARAGDDETASGLELGADDYLVKPFSARELLARVRSQLTMTALRASVAEQEAHAAELGVRHQELKKLLDARDEFLSVASHELKTPITALRVQVEMTERAIAAGRTVTGERLANLLRVSARQATRLTKLVDDLLDVARVRADKLELVREEMDLAQTVREAIERLDGVLKEAGCEVTTTVPPRVVGWWDERRLEQVVTNLLSNVARYAPGRPCEVQLEERGEGDGHGARTVRLSVRDGGPGVPLDQRETIFDRFDRGSASRNAGGLGLGLFIAREVALAHGGSLAVEEPDGGGARFVVELPRGVS